MLSHFPKISQVVVGGTGIQNEAWNGFKGKLWRDEVNVRDFIQNNYTPYEGDSSFLEAPTEATAKLWKELQKLQKEEHAKNGVLDMETEVVTGLTAYGAGYICEDGKNLEQVVGLQTDKPLKRAFMPYGGIKMAEESCEMYGYKPNPELHKIFTEYHKTHNQGVFDVYTPEIRAARKNHIVTGLPDGNVAICGRKSDMIKINGNRIEPAEIETALRSVLNIEWCAVRGFVSDEHSFICAYYKDDISFDEGELRAQLQKRLPYYMIPAYFMKIDSIPVKPNGKMDRNALPKPEVKNIVRTFCIALQRAASISEVGSL